MCPDIPDRPDDEVSVQAEFALDAARKAIAESGREPEEIDLVVVGASSLQRPYPAIAIEVQASLDASGFAFDVSAGCSSGVYALQLAHDAIQLGRARCALVCIPEIPSAYANFKDRDSHFILGDASAAVVLEADRPGFEILACRLVSKYSNNVRNNCGFLNRCDTEHRDEADKLFYQEGRRVFRDIVKLVPTIIEAQLGELKLTASDVRPVLAPPGQRAPQRRDRRAPRGPQLERPPANNPGDAREHGRSGRLRDLRQAPRRPPGR